MVRVRPISTLYAGATDTNFWRRKHGPPHLGNVGITVGLIILLGFRGRGKGLSDGLKLSA